MAEPPVVAGPRARAFVVAAAAIAAGVVSLAAGSIAPRDGAGPDRSAAGQDTPRTRDDVLPPVLDLMARHDCLACHAPASPLRAALDPVAAPKLKNVSSRVPYDWLVAFLEDPRSVRPETTHPHQLVAIPENARTRLAEDIAHFLHAHSGKKARVAGGPFEPESSNIGTLERGRALFHEVGCVVCHGPQESAEDLEYPLAVLVDSTDPANEGTDGDAEGSEVERDEPVEEGDAAGATDDAEDMVLPEVPTRPGVFEPKYEPLRSDLARKYRPSTLARFLENPVALRPSGHCPSMSLTAAEARAIADYLLRESARRPDGSFERVPGLVRETFVGEFRGDTAAAFELLDTTTPETAEVTTTIAAVPAPRDDHYGVRYSGLLDVQEPGPTTFHLRSDDGSRLYLDGDVVIDNGGTHAPRTMTATVDLEEGLYALRVDFYDVGGGASLSLQWNRGAAEPTDLPATALSHWPLVYDQLGSAGPNPANAPFQRESVRVERGRKAFARLGCTACHAGPPGMQATLGVAPPPTFEQLEGVRPGVLVCLRPDGRFDFEQEDVGRLLAAFLDGATEAAGYEEPEIAIERKMLRRNCYGCHRRHDLGGVHPTLMPFFTGDEEAELGDQGRFPPTLSVVGAKLKLEVLRAALEGNVGVRPYLDTRMPKIGVRNVGTMAELLEAADRRRVTRPPVEAPFDCEADTIDAGRRLAGDRGGLGCVQCHDFLGTPSLGVRAVDLGTMRDRLRFDWFRQLLLDPSSVDLASRMANVWVDGMSPVDSIEGGDVEAQIRALWCWLGEGPTMAPPPGLDSGPWAYEVLPNDGLRLVSVFMRDVSPRVLCIGTPEGVHSAFDEENGRLAKVWRGRFLNAMGTWQGRAGSLESPPSTDTFDLPPGPVVTALTRLDAPWPTAPRAALDAAPDPALDEAALLAPAMPPTRSLGRTVHPDGAVTMRYTCGRLVIEETLRPTFVEEGLGGDAGGARRAGLERTLKVTAPAGGVGDPVIARVLAARRIDRQAIGRFALGGDEWPRVVLDPDSAKVAKVVQARPLSASESRVGDRHDRPEVDGRYRRNSASRSQRVQSETVLDELRIPVHLTPATDGSGELVGTLSWSLAW